MSLINKTVGIRTVPNMFHQICSHSCSWLAIWWISIQFTVYGLLLSDVPKQQISVMHKQNWPFWCCCQRYIWLSLLLML